MAQETGHSRHPVWTWVTDVITAFAIEDAPTPGVAEEDLIAVQQGRPTDAASTKALLCKWADDVHLVVDLLANPLLYKEVAEHELLPLVFVAFGNIGEGPRYWDRIGQAFSSGYVDGYCENRRGVPSPRERDHTGWSQESGENRSFDRRP